MCTEIKKVMQDKAKKQNQTKFAVEVADEFITEYGENAKINDFLNFVDGKYDAKKTYKLFVFIKSIYLTMEKNSWKLEVSPKTLVEHSNVEMSVEDIYTKEEVDEVLDKVIKAGLTDTKINFYVKVMLIWEGIENKAIKEIKPKDVNYINGVLVIQTKDKVFEFVDNESFIYQKFYNYVLSLSDEDKVFGKDGDKVRVSLDYTQISLGKLKLSDGGIVYRCSKEKLPENEKGMPRYNRYLNTFYNALSDIVYK